MNAGIWWSQRNEILLMIGVPTPWYVQLLPMPEGCMECNGQNVDDPDSPIYGQTLPNLNDGRVLIGSLGDCGIEVGPSGAGLLLNRGHLPQVSLTADTDSVSAGTPSGTLSIGSASAGTPAGTVANSTDGAHTHTSDRATGTPINASILALGTPVVEKLVQTPTADGSAGAHTHTATFTGTAMAGHGHSGTFSGQALGDHQHSVSVPLNPDAQQSIDLTPKGITCRWIMRIK